MPTKPRIAPDPEVCRSCGTRLQGELDEPLLTKEQVANKLQRTERFIDKKAELGLPYEQIDGARRFYFSRVMAWFRRRAAEPHS